MSSNKINIAVAGATGYVGLDLIKILSLHPRVIIKYLCAQKKIGKKKNGTKKTKRYKKRMAFFFSVQKKWYIRIFAGLT